ncbi:phosphatase PAP2/dual specificity phosphatase family protein [Shinella zoogloeoides]|uniref:phosphatase PAP2/dual specificity phosphatase family protein n=1 Tax=Shinella zoogloeoides TaxID=352475 RepID=UPI00273EB7F2|nr:phosphatase PAP2/dual specificity phosphatase family protein [Shinella zoogloeoides]WLR95263.1 phosphatase PAP2/dual specificity phosphatase family protein [Shinella zoogloeoides]
MGEGVASVPAVDRRAVFRAAALWLAVLAPFFYLTYGTANWLASLRADVPNLAFGWERYIPFIAWTIVPYWSINAFYALSLFVNETPEEVGRLARRYLTAQIVAVACFIAFPLQAIFVRPETDGLPGFMFDVLGGFDKPFNQAPSLHIALLVIIWDHWRGRLRGAGLALWHVWSLLIGLSVLTTRQHHIIDIPTGALLGLFALWLFPPRKPSPLAGFRLTDDPKAWRLATCYAAGAAALLVLTVLATRDSGAGLLLLWPALALAIVALGYAGAGTAVFQKQADGRITLASRWLLMPYRAGARLNVRWWTRRLPAATEIADGIFLGRVPRRHELSTYVAVIDMAAELPGLAVAGLAWRAFPSLDLIPVPAARIRDAALVVEEARRHGPVLICCALGFQRSAVVAACALVRAGHAGNAAAAVAQIKVAGRPVHLPFEAYARIEEAAR